MLETIKADINPYKLVTCVCKGHNTMKPVIQGQVTAKCLIPRAPQQFGNINFFSNSAIKVVQSSVVVGYLITSTANLALMVSQKSLMVRGWYLEQTWNFSVFMMPIQNFSGKIFYTSQSNRSCHLENKRNNTNG